MARILVLGSAPLPFMNAKRLYGPGIRTWQFASPLLERGHEVRIVAGQAPRCELEEANAGSGDRLSILCLPQADFEAVDPVRQGLEGFQPDAIVSAGYGASNVAVRLEIGPPIWADFFGDPMAEAQALARVLQDDNMVFRVWSYVAPVLDRADRFSVVSERQKCSLIGQLAARGRLNMHSMGYDPVKVVPCGIASLPHGDEESLQGRDLPEGAFLVLWSGGYNTWADVDTLFRALCLAMEQRQEIHFVSTGGSIQGHDERTYPRFLEAISSCEMRERFHLFGWVETSEVPSFYKVCDVGINVDRFCYEGFLGSRNRILDWMNAGLTVLTTESCELSQILADEDLGVVVPPGDAEALARALVSLVDDRASLKQRAERAQAFARDRFSFETTAQPLVEWAKSPCFAEDRFCAPRLGNPWTVCAQSLRRKWTDLRWMARVDGLKAALLAAGRGLYRRVGEWRKRKG